MEPKIAVVTGAGTGLGRHITLALAGAGWEVAAAGRRPGPLDETAAAAAQPAGHAAAAADRTDAAVAGQGAVGQLGPVYPVPTDVSDPAQVAALFDVVRSRWGRIDLLVNNAGVFGPGGTVDQLEPEGWQRIVDTNLTGSFLCAHHAVRLMKEQDPRGGRIINNGSISAHVPRPGSVGYTATKHAITGLTKSISLDGRPYGIACGQIDIGNAATELTAAISQGAPQANGELMAEPTFDARHAADAVLYMASLPLDANVQFITVMATTMPYIGRG